MAEKKKKAAGEAVGQQQYNAQVAANLATLGAQHAGVNDPALAQTIAHTNAAVQTLPGQALAPAGVAVVKADPGKVSKTYLMEQVVGHDLNGDGVM